VRDLGLVLGFLSLDFRVRDSGLVLGFRLPDQVDKKKKYFWGLDQCWGV